MTDKEYIAHIEQETGLSFEKGDFGFILGTHSPFDPQGHMSSNDQPGYTIWRRNIGDSESNYRQMMTKYMSIEDTIAFLTLSHENLMEFFNKKGFFSIDTRNQRDVYESE